jgi:hypothetical protein
VLLLVGPILILIFSFSVLHILDQDVFCRALICRGRSTDLVNFIFIVINSNDLWRFLARGRLSRGRWDHGRVGVGRL